MRRPLIAVLFVAGFSVLSSPAGAKAAPPTVGDANDENDAVVIINPGASSPGKAAPAGRRISGRRRSSGPLPEHVITRYHFRPTEGEGSCMYSTTTRRDTPLDHMEMLDNEAILFWARTHGVPTCDEEDAEAAPSPDQVAAAFLRQIPLPPPEPRIAPDGQAITGLAAYLETNGTLAHRVGPSTTELGPIVVEASSVYWVDWGDGSPEAGPFAFEGEAYPTGRIYHGYRYRGDYVVTVRQAWTAEWRLGAESGTVDGLVTEASVPVHVDEVQAVIRR